MSHESMGARITRLLRDEVLDGTLPPGFRIRQEELAERWGVSRIPVREALQALESEGLVVLRRSSGAWVAHLDNNEAQEYYKMREQLEPLAVAESVPHLDADQLVRLRELVLEMEGTKDPAVFLRLDRQFHLLSYAAAGMPRLLETVEGLWNSTQPYRRVYNELVGDDGFEIIYAQHRLLLDALERNDPEEAASVVRSHIRRTRILLSTDPTVLETTSV